MMTRFNRRNFLKASLLGSGGLLLGGCAHSVARDRAGQGQRPNIVLILADDMGYGDVRSYNPDSKTPTPNIDRLGFQGVRFTDAHAPGASCIPSRYGLMTGQYPFRAKMDLQRSIIEPGRMTLASLLKDHGYRTGCIGKWHLGFEGGAEDIDFNKPMRGGPVDHGFDYFFGMHASLDIPPYYYIENDRCVAPPTGYVEASNSPDVTHVQGAFWRKGGMAPGFKHDEVLPLFTKKTVEFIKNHTAERSDAPFFAYMSLAAPHTPWLPTEGFIGSSNAGAYGDFVAQVDWAVGAVLEALNALGLEEDTLVIFTSDNGPVWFDADIARYDHRSTHCFRGIKFDAYEGGHRMPFVARWPGRIAPGSVSDETICFTDMLATFGAVVGTRLPENAGEDSYNVLPAFNGASYEGSSDRGIVVEKSIRRGDWKLILGEGESGLSRQYNADGPREARDIPGELFHLRKDIGETNNLYEQQPEIVKDLTALMDSYRKKGRSVAR
jgi:arylsulfatase A